MSITTPNINEWPLIKVYDTDFRPELKDMADTVTRLELWDWLRNEKPPENTGYTYWNHENIRKINNGLTNDTHSGATFGYAMRCMQYISENGFDSWKEKVINL